MKQVLVAYLLFTSLSGFAQNINKTKLDSLFVGLDTNQKVMGSIALYKNGKVLYTNAIGHRHIKGVEKLRPNSATKYRIGSITKMFTATMIFQLVDEKKLTLDTKLSAFFPRMVNADKITIVQLLNHHSGIHSFTNDEAFISYYTKTKTQAQMLEILYQLKADFEPGAKGKYSNTNYVLLGYIIENITGNTYADELKTRITKKIKLEDTYFGTAADVKKNEALSYTYQNGDWTVEPQTDMSVPHGAGAIVSTPTDLGRFATAVFQRKLFSDSLLKKMVVQTDGYGMGCFESPFYEKTSLGHTGSIDAFQSSLNYFGNDSLVVAFSSNGINYEMNDVLIAVLNIVYNKPYELPNFKTFELKNTLLTAYEGVYEAPGFPTKITIKVKDGKLTAQATGQNAFPLDAKSDTHFVYNLADIEIDFSIETGGIINSFNFRQSGLELLFTKEK